MLLTTSPGPTTVFSMSEKGPSLRCAGRLRAYERMREENCLAKWIVHVHMSVTRRAHAGRGLRLTASHRAAYEHVAFPDIQDAAF